MGAPVPRHALRPTRNCRKKSSKAKASGAVVFATLQYNEQPLGEYSYETASVAGR